MARTKTSSALELLIEIDRGDPEPLRRQVIAEADSLADRPVVAVYGTLRRGERNHRLMVGAEFLGRGAIRGRLHHMPTSTSRAYTYPALVDDPAGRVVVELWRLPDRATLSRLDVLEAYDPLDEEGSEYVRYETEVVDGPVALAWAYRYNGDPAGLGDWIERGDWRRA